MTNQDLSVISLLADIGNGEVQDPATDLQLVTGADDAISTPNHIVHWDAEWHWDPIYTQYPHLALGGHIVTLGLTNAQQIWSEYTKPIFDWVHQQSGIAGFAHLQYLGNGFPQTLTCCIPVEYPVEVALGACDFISEDVAGGDSAMLAYYRLLNCGFRPGFAGGSDHPCGAGVGSVITYVQTPAGLTYSNWIQGIKSGRTVVSRTGHNQFLQLTVNGSASPGDEIQLTGGGSMPVTVEWTATEDLPDRTIQLVQNSVVVASKSASVTSGTTNSLSATVDFTKSGWLCARTMGANGHELHTAAVFVRVNGLEVRASVADAQFYVQWMDNLLTNTSPGGIWASYFVTNRAEAQARYLAAKTNYQTIATEAAASDPYGSGPGGPILVVTNGTNPFSTYYAEILLNEGLNEFALKDVSSILPGTLSAYDVVVLGETALSAGQVATLTDWVNAGGNLIAMKPDKQLAGLLGLNDAAATITNRYLLVNTATGPGVGIYGATMQFHGIADLYTPNGSAFSLATLYSGAATATTNPAVTIRSVGANGGQAAAFTFDLARSVVLTRQGNPAWADQNRDGDALMRSDDLFYGAASFDPQPDWVDLNKVAIPQADEQQRLLANMILSMNGDKKLLPRFWYFPQGHQAVVVMTGDDHANGGTAGRFDQYLAASPVGGSVDDWATIRGSSYIYANTPLTDAQAAAYQAAGFEFGYHLNTGCASYTPAELTDYFRDQLEAWIAKFPSLGVPTTHRMHCVAWSGYTLLPEVGLTFGIRMDTSYYHYPGSWVANKPGFITGSGMPMRFATTNGNVIDVFQAATQMTDESGQAFPDTIDALLDKALGPEQFYGAFVANMHTDFNTPTTPGQVGSDAIITSATNHGVPVISARQLLTWLDARNGSSISSIVRTVNSGTNFETFSIAARANARGLQAMVPVPSGKTVSEVRRAGLIIANTLVWVKGIQYASFLAPTGDYQITYGPDSSPPVVTHVTPAAGATGVSVGTTVAVMFSKPMDASTINTSTITVRGPGAALVPATVAYDPSTFTVTAVLTPNSPLAVSTIYTVMVASGSTGVKDVAGNALVNDFTASFTTEDQPTYSIWSALETQTPFDSSYNGDGNGAIEVGVKFKSATNGYVTGIRFYKGVGNTGTHTGNLWSSGGTLLGRVTFSGETASGWQYQALTNPVPISSNTTYVASYFAPNNHYAVDTALQLGNLLAGVNNPPLRALANGEDGGNGVYRYNTSSTFPNISANGANYWVDLVFVESLGPDTNGPTVVAVNPVNGAVGVGVTTPVTVTFSEAMDPLSITNGIILSNSSGGLVASTVAYYDTTKSAVLTPNSPLALSTTYTVMVASGSAGVKDVAGNALTNDFTASFATADQPTYSIWSALEAPVTPSWSSDGGGAIELGVKFKSATNGYVMGIRFYKGAGNTGTHTGNLWSSDGTLLGRVTFSGETAAGWQYQALTNPVPISSNTTYVASYFAPNNHYAVDFGYFTTSGRTNYPLWALANGEDGGNGVYRYNASSTFPADSANGINWWVDVVFERPVLTIVADAQTKTYGSDDPALTYTVTGLLPGDTTQTVLTGALTRVAGETVGGYAITQGTLAANSNYTVSFTGNTLTLNAKALNITANSTSKTYGQTVTFAGTEFTSGAGELVTGDSVTSVTLGSAGVAAGAVVGDYPIMATNAEGTGLANYLIAYADGTLTVTNGLFGISSVTVSNGMATVTWSAVATTIYRLQYKTNLTDVNWTEIAPDVTASGSTASTTTALGGDAQRFFRVRLLP